jgi:uncharacterized protein DUF4129
MRLRAGLVLVIVALARFASGDPVSLSLAEYKTQLEHYTAEIRKIADHPEHAVDVNRDAPRTLPLHTPAGDVNVSLEFLHTELEKYLTVAPSFKPPILSHLSDRINAMRDEADAFGQARDGSAATRQRLDQILAAREFGGVSGPTELELLEQRIRAWLRDKWSKLFPKTPDLDQLGQILVWIMIAVASSVFIVWLYRQSRERLTDRPRQIMPFAPSARSWRSWLSEAQGKAALGEWRQAIRLGFWASVSRLEGEGVWRPDKARTPREYLNAIPAGDDTKAPFTAVTKTFEAAWYGRRPASADDFQRFMTEIEKLGCRE